MNNPNPPPLKPGWLQRVFDQNERDIDALPETIRRAAHERVYGPGSYDLSATLRRARAIKDAEQRVVAAAVAEIAADKASMAFQKAFLDDPETPLDFEAMGAAVDRWKAARRELYAAVDDLTALRGDGGDDDGEV